jgi:hypothetical protein
VIAGNDGGVITGNDGMLPKPPGPGVKIEPLPAEGAVYVLFLSEEYLHRASEEVKVRTELVLQEALVWVADVLRKVAEECE